MQVRVIPSRACHVATDAWRGRVTGLRPCAPVVVELALEIVDPGLWSANLLLVVVVLREVHP